MLIFKWLINNLIIIILFINNNSNFILSTPTFDRHIENITVIIGTAALLPCYINDLGDHKVAWIKVGNTEIISIGDFKITNDERINIPHSYVHDWSLLIDQVNEEDIGEYICQVNTEPQKVKKILLHVLLPPKIVEEKSTINPNPVSEGETLTLLCYVDGLPIPKVTWYFRKKVSNSNNDDNYNINNNELIFNYDKSQTSALLNKNMIPIHEGNTLIIENINRSYSGYFECIANNSVPPAASRKIKVTVEFPPEIIVDINKFERIIGTDVRLECKIKANPLINHYWIKDGRVIENSVDLEYKFDDRGPLQRRQQLDSKYEININHNNNEFTTTSSLFIKNISKVDFGSYNCFAVNKFKTVKSAVELKEIIIPKKQTTETLNLPINIKTHTNLVNSNLIEIHSNNKNNFEISTVTIKSTRKYHKKLNHSSSSGIARNENDINSELDRSKLLHKISRSDINIYSKLLILFNIIIYFSYNHFICFICMI